MKARLVFLLVGLGLFIADHWLAYAGYTHRIPLVITASQQVRIALEWSAASGRMPTKPEQQQLLDKAVVEEVLYREALRRGLDRNNPAVNQRLALLARLLKGEESLQATPDEVESLAQEARLLGLEDGDLVIRRYLIHQMRLLASLQPTSEPSLTELQGLLKKHQSEFMQPDEWDLEHVYFSIRRHGRQAERVSRTALDALRKGVQVQGADSWPSGSKESGLTTLSASDTFGPELATLLPSAKAGEWFGPFQSRYGWHLFKVTAHRPEHLPELEQVKGPLLALWTRAQQAERFESYYPTLRRRYQLDIEAVPEALWTQPLHALRPEAPDVPD